MLSATQRIQELTQLPATEKPKIALDTNCVEYYLNDPPRQPWADCLDPIFHAALEGKVELYVSTVVVSELLAHVHFANRRSTGYDAELALMALLNRHFQILDVDGEVARAAGRLRGNYAPGDKLVLKTPDALIAATSLANGHTLFVTNDEQLAHALPEDTRIYLRDVALELLAQRFPGPCLNGSGSVRPLRRGPGLPGATSLATLELGSVKPDASVSWRRLLGEAFTVASALNEPCVIVVLTRRNGRKTEAVEVLHWQEGLEGTRPASRILKRLQEHLGYSRRTRKAANERAHAHVFCFTSRAREKARQSQACFDTKSEHRRSADGWQGYLSPLWQFRSALDLPQMTFLLCEDGSACCVKPLETRQFLDEAKNVLGLEDRR